MKKFLALLMILAGCILAFLAVFTLTELNMRMPETSDTTNKTSFVIGYLFGVLLCVVPAFFLIRYGVRKMRQEDKIY
jgi:drug/metabolite transporter (DMT)-like permease